MVNSFLRLEIDGSGISVRVFEKKNKTYVIAQEEHLFFQEPENDHRFSDSVDSVLTRILGQMNLERCTCAIVFLSSLSVRFRTISLPFSAPKKIRQVIDFELEAALPAIDSHYTTDFHVTGLTGKMTRILCASVDQSLIDIIFSHLAEYKIDPEWVIPKGLAAGLCFLNDNRELSNFLFLYIAESEMTLTLVYNNVPCAVRAVSAEDMTDEKVRLFVRQTLLGFYQRTGLDVSFEGCICVESRLIKKGVIHAEPIAFLIEKELSSLPVKGGADRLEPRRVISTQILDETLLNRVTPDHKIKLMFDFCKGRFDRTSFIRSNINKIVVSCILFAIAVVLAILGVNLDSKRLKNKIEMIDLRAAQIFMDTFPETKKIQDPYLQMKANVMHAVKSAGDKIQTGQENGPQKHLQAVTVLSELSQRISGSARIQLTQFLLNERLLIISGSTDNFNTVDQLKNMIESSSMFLRVDISSAVTDKRENRVNFKFNIEI